MSLRTTLFRAMLILNAGLLLYVFQTEGQVSIADNCLKNGVSILEHEGKVITCRSYTQAFQLPKG